MSAYNLPPGTLLRDVDPPTRCAGGCGSTQTCVVVVKPDGDALHYCADCAPDPVEEDEDE